MLKFRRITFVAVGLLLFSVYSSYGQAVQEPALVVNGMPIEGGVKTINGKVYVDIAAAAKALNVTVRKNAAVVILESNNRSATSQDSGGSLVGNLSYYFNKNYGNKPDVGSKVYVIDGSSDFNPTKAYLMVAAGGKLVLSLAKVNTEFPVLFSTSADGNGRFEIKSLLPVNTLL